MLEVGPGPGGLTRALLAAGASRVIAIERDPRCVSALAELAEATQGFFYEAASVSELKQVYEDMGSSIGHRVEPREVTQWYAGVALLFGLIAACMSLLWTSRLP